ncbi:hypothetical protein M8542_32090 [Amycolatopsis sp. OK19-0408]|uniref:Uncharacterized protein n=1 Tax=Amycolatopsis iheyensis TaxID=2945988 RepID=A0A9X2SMS4_9PSEU|nr:hypothetical protein [Amycolatopsis iheyensis]MCR6487478.1 hypothetical protein [Amycolatopsis iheyensis]
MKLRLVLALGAALVTLLVSTPAAVAGNWATTYLDPLPETLRAGQPYTVGYWVLQHGSHPSYGELGPTALVLTPAQGDPVVFPGVALREPAHYAAAIAVPTDGVWRVSARQGIFAGYDIGTLTLPGRLEITPPPAPMPAGEPLPWGAIRPPVNPVSGGGAVQAAPERPTSFGSVLLVTGLVIVVGAGLVGGLRWRRRAQHR